ncbi:hypothetical protein QEN19_001045 [Hanseniaspora menglaensis]
MSKAEKKTITLDDIEYKNLPNQAKINKLMENLEENKHIVIIGAGIIGVSTAYYLTRHKDFNPEKHHITLLESTRVAGGASGKSGGLLATWAFPSQLAPYSFQLHQELADEYSGGDLWDYKRLTSISLEADIRDENIRSKIEKDGEKVDGPKRSGKLKEIVGCSIPAKTTVAAKPFFDNSNNIDNGRSNSKIGAFMDSDEEDEDDMFGDDFDFPSTGGQMMNRAMPSAGLSVPMGPRTSSTGFSSNLRSFSTQSSNLGPAPTTVNSDTLETDESHLDEKMPETLNWINKALVKNWSSLGGEDSTAIVHPLKFTIFLMQKAIESGAVDLVLGSITKIYFNNGGEGSIDTVGLMADLDELSITGVDYIQTDDSIPLNFRKTVHLKATHTIVCMGPWTSKLLKDCPVNGLRAHSIIVKPSKEDESRVTPYAIFSELRSGDKDYFSPELYVRNDEIYICGEGDTMTDLPDTTAQVEVLDKRCQELYTSTAKMSKAIAGGHITKKQACYLPIVNVPTTSGPLIGETNVNGLYVGVGHSCWGINNAPASGKLLSQLVFEGEFKDANLSSLDPTLYFDASL